MSASDPTRTSPPTMTPAEELTNLGAAKRANGDLDGAMADHNRAIEMKPGLAPAYNNRALVKQAKGDFDGALADLTRAIELDPNLAPAHLNRGDLKRIRGDLAGAVIDLTRAIELKPDTAIAYNNRGVVQQALRQFDEAIADYTKAMELAPTNVTFLKNRATARRAKGDTAGADADLLKIAELQPESADSRFRLARAKWQNGDFAGALADFDRAATLYPYDYYIYGQRGMLKRVMGDLDGSIADFEHTLQLEPKLPIIKQALKLTKRERAAAKKKPVAPKAISSEKQILLTEGSLLLRTDFSDAAGWKSLCSGIQKVDDGLSQSLNIVADRAFDGVTPETLRRHLDPSASVSFAFIADRTALAQADHPILVTNLDGDPPQTFRVLASELAQVETNLSTANMSFEEFADAAGDDRIFRGL
jgi:tetratricopeptide (TPR) repeat protein